MLRSLVHQRAGCCCIANIGLNGHCLPAGMLHCCYGFRSFRRGGVVIDGNLCAGVRQCNYDCTAYAVRTAGD